MRLLISSVGVAYENDKAICFSDINLHDAFIV
jgi:hypothetical protein